MASGEFQPLTRELLVGFYGRPQLRTVRGFAYVVEGRALVIVGVFIENGVNVLFSEWTPEAKDMAITVGKRRLIALGAAKVLDMIKDMGVRVFARADCRIPGADILLKHLGFVPVDPEKQPEIFVWQA